MDGSTTPSRAGLTIFDPTTPQTAAAETQLATPISLVWESPKPKTPVQETQIPPVLAQTDVDANPTVKRLQQDLLILTGFNDNATLHWRPTWFTQGSFPGSLWTIHNPPDVVTERLPNNDNGAQMFTRRMRRSNDPPPLYIKSWGHWKRYCDLYGVSYDFLCERHIRLIRMGLPRSSDGSLRTPPRYPLYPEPSPKGYYVLDPSIYSTQLPRRFQNVVSASPQIDLENAEVIVVNFDGALVVESQRDHFPYHERNGHRWSYIPWTTEMEKSCQPLTVKLRLWKEVQEVSKSGGNGMERRWVH